MEPKMEQWNLFFKGQTQIVKQWQNKDCKLAAAVYVLVYLSLL